jgi:hypothetical protein
MPASSKEHGKLVTGGGTIAASFTLDGQWAAANARLPRRFDNCRTGEQLVDELVDEEGEGW